MESGQDKWLSRDDQGFWGLPVGQNLQALRGETAKKK